MCSKFALRSRYGRGSIDLKASITPLMIEQRNDELTSTPFLSKRRRYSRSAGAWSSRTPFMAAKSYPPTIASRSKEFLVDLFLGLRSDLEQQLRDGGSVRPEPRRAARTRATYDALLSSLTTDSRFPDDEHLRAFVAEMAASTDEANDYERVSFEHWALEELSQAVSDVRPVCGSRSA